MWKKKTDPEEEHPDHCVRVSPECTIVNSSSIGTGALRPWDRVTSLLGHPPTPSYRAKGCNDAFNNVMENFSLAA